MTKGDKRLSGPQQKAINLFLAGMNDTEVAEELGLARQTVNKWRNKNQNFGAKLEQQQRELNKESRQQLSGLVSRSVEVLRQSLESENERIRQSTVVHVLKATGFYRPESRRGSGREDEANMQTLIAQFHAMRFIKLRATGVSTVNQCLY